MQIEIVKAIYESIDFINSEKDEDASLIEKALEEKLFSEGGSLSSIEFVNFIVSLEDNIGKEFNKRIGLISEEAFSSASNPFASVGDLAIYIEKLLVAQQ